MVKNATTTLVSLLHDLRMLGKADIGLFVRLFAWMTSSKSSWQWPVSNIPSTINLPEEKWGSSQVGRGPRGCMWQHGWRSACLHTHHFIWLRGWKQQNKKFCLHFKRIKPLAITTRVFFFFTFALLATVKGGKDVLRRGPATTNQGPTGLQGSFFKAAVKL